jgi:hypothetical protein
VVRRRQEEDVASLLPTIHHLTERQHQLFFLFHSVISRFTPVGLARLLDADVADAAAALAATIETAARGVIYEHAPSGPPAQALAAELKAALALLREQEATVYDHEVAVVLRAIEEGARSLSATRGGQTAYLDLLARLLQTSGTGESDASTPASTLILP